jgi:hypothetical protein
MSCSAAADTVRPFRFRKKAVLLLFLIDPDEEETYNEVECVGGGGADAVGAGELERAVQAPLPGAAITRVAHLMNSHTKTQPAMAQNCSCLQLLRVQPCRIERDTEKRGANHGGRCYICSCSSQSQQETEQEEDEGRRQECSSSAHDVADPLPFPPILKRIVPFEIGLIACDWGVVGPLYMPCRRAAARDMQKSNAAESTPGNPKIRADLPTAKNSTRTISQALNDREVGAERVQILASILGCCSNSAINFVGYLFQLSSSLTF